MSKNQRKRRRKALTKKSKTSHKDENLTNTSRKRITKNAVSQHFNKKVPNV